MPENEFANNLINEKSPYLLQHAHDPVNWYPWGEEAFQEANSKQLPIFLSIGYSSCHWCHVMHDESFKNQELAELLNASFVSIKVDREERPDIDTIYMSVCQAINGQGGWPLTIIMAPDKKPFFAATYVPLHSQRGMAGLIEILASVKDLWAGNKSELLETGQKISEWLNVQETWSQEELDESIMKKAYNYLAERFDEQYGGFGSAPKFPSPHQLYFLLRYYYINGETKALNMVEKTLESMYRGGIYDHIAGGFARYSTDRYWLVPHFEKMLYDNALLAMAYLEAYQITGKNLFMRAVEEIFNYVLRDMRSEEGGFFSSEDADSPCGEGSFYVWSPGEIKECLGEGGEYFCRLYDINKKGNFEGKSIPNLIKGLPEENEWSRLDEYREKLRLARELRPRPRKDDKVLCSWNALMIAALAVGSRVMQQPAYLQVASAAADFLLDKLSRSDGRLLARYREGEAAHLAYLDDYAFLVWALLELYEASCQPQWLQKALNLNDDLINLFSDVEEAGFFFYGWDGEALISRPKEIYDGAMPSGNSVATLNLIKLARLSGRNDLEEKAREQIQHFAGQVKHMPGAYTFFLCACQFYLAPPMETTVIGDRDAADTRAMIRELNKQYRPFSTNVFKDESEDCEVYRCLASLEDMHSIKGQVTAYLCSDRSCLAPIVSLEELSAQLIGLQPAWFKR